MTWINTLPAWLIKQLPVLRYTLLFEFRSVWLARSQDAESGHSTFKSTPAHFSLSNITSAGDICIITPRNWQLLHLMEAIESKLASKLKKDNECLITFSLCESNQSPVTPAGWDQRSVGYTQRGNTGRIISVERNYVLRAVSMQLPT